MGESRGDLWITRAMAVLLILIGLAIGGGGIVLVSLGGSFYYVLGGITVLVSGVSLWQRHALALHLYAAFLIATLIWSLTEVGADGWALAPRLIAPAIVGLFLGTPWVRRPIAAMDAGCWSLLSSAGAGLLLLITIAAVAVATNGAPTVALPVTARPLAPVAVPNEWPAYGRTEGGDRFSPLAQITPANVSSLQPAWVYHSGVHQSDIMSSMEVTPIMIGDSVYLCTQNNIVIALDPETGGQKWRYDPKVNLAGAAAVTTCRGVAYYRASTPSECPERIIAATFDARLIALDAHTGLPCQSFGNRGTVDLRSGLGPTPAGFYYVSSAPTIARGKIVLGGWVSDDQNLDMPSGVIRAFDAQTGRLAWAWDAGRTDQHGEPAPGQTYTRSTPNSWAPMSADEQLGLVYVPTGNPAVDHWGGARSPAAEQFGSSLVAIDAETGERRWSFQTAHHDLWDYDVASQPTLLDMPTADGVVPAVAQATKRGQIFIFNRETGALLTKVEERPVPQRGAVPGEKLSQTQPFAIDMPDFAGPPLREVDMWGVTPIDQLFCRIAFRRLRYEGQETPPGEKDWALVYPSIGGAMNWGGVSVDPVRGLMIVNSMYYAATIRLIPRAEADRLVVAAKAQSHNFGLPLPQTGAPYAVMLKGFESPLAAPCNQPPYGRLSAVDLATHKLLWSRPLGSARDIGPLGIASHIPLSMGMPQLGGSMTTASGLTFIGATQDRTFRAIETATGRTLWSARIPGGGQANPMSYISPVSHRQFVVIAAGGHLALRSPMSDAVVGYALPLKGDSAGSK